MAYADLANLSDEQLVHRELGLERDLVSAKFRLATNQLEDSSQLGKLRKDIARCRTAERSREKEQGLGKNALRAKYSSTFDASAAATSAAQDEGAGSGFLKGVVDKIGGGE